MTSIICIVVSKYYRKVILFKKGQRNMKSLKFQQWPVRDLGHRKAQPLHQRQENLTLRSQIACQILVQLVSACTDILPRFLNSLIWAAHTNTGDHAYIYFLILRYIRVLPHILIIIVFFPLLKNCLMKKENLQSIALLC